MNGYVVAWMALSPIGGPSIAVGILLGRKLQHRDSYDSGFGAGRVMGEYDARLGGVTATERLDALRRQSAGVVGGHGHDGPCSPERGCF